MSNIGPKEILTWKHVIQFFQDELGYHHLNHWKDSEGLRDGVIETPEKYY